MKIQTLGRFVWVAGRLQITAAINNVVVKVHLGLTPQISTPNTLSEIALEQTALWQRRLAIRAYEDLALLHKLGKEILGE